MGGAASSSLLRLFRDVHEVQSEDGGLGETALHPLCRSASLKQSERAQQFLSTGNRREQMSSGGKNEISSVEIEIFLVKIEISPVKIEISSIKI